MLRLVQSLTRDILVSRSRQSRPPLLPLVTLQHGQNLTYIQRLTNSRQPVGSVFHALSFFHGPRVYFGYKITFFLRKLVHIHKITQKVKKP